MKRALIHQLRCHKIALMRTYDWQVWFVGHATVLIQIGPYNFITDPVWCYASPLHGRGPRRVCPAVLPWNSCQLFMGFY